MDLGLDGKVALVTGGSRGIGRAIAEVLAAEGARVAITSRDERTAAETAGAIAGEVQAHAFDSDDLAAVDGLVDAVTRDLGPIDVYVANTGGPPMGIDPLGFTDEQWEAAHRTLVVSPMAILRRVVPGMRERGWGRVLAVSSSAALEPIQGLQLSNANRPGLLAAFKQLAREHAADGVTYNAVLPGRIATDRIAGHAGGMENAQAAARAEVPAGRLGEVAEIAAAAAFLVSAPAAYITGQSLRVDGALTRSWA
jgi:3-oxoacyl-[acyl-carrier protein] reductase